VPSIIKISKEMEYIILNKKEKIDFLNLWLKLEKEI
jgi:hypothetical protein